MQSVNDFTSQMPEAVISVSVDRANPGQFFACCGLLELANRMQPGGLAWFEDERYCIARVPTLENVVEAVLAAELLQLDPNDDTSSPMRLGEPFGLVLDWWWQKKIVNSKVKLEIPHTSQELKVWAGTMESVRIADAMRRAIGGVGNLGDLFDYATVVYEPGDSDKKVEPYYFDSRRGWNAMSVDIGFSTDKLKMTTAAYPAVEFLCLVGLQRFRPAATEHRRVFDYTTWSKPLDVISASACCQGLVPQVGRSRFRFENGFRTNKKQHKSFLPAIFLGDL